MLPCLPDEIIERIARLSGVDAWLFTWSKVSSHYTVEWLRAATPLTLVPDDAQTINAGISSAHNSPNGEMNLVLVRPGTYTESVRVTGDVILIGLGARGSVRVQAPGWEPALVLGGFSVGRAKLRDGGFLAAASAGGRARVHHISLSTRNQQQAVVVYCTSGAQRVTHCDIHGNVRISGSAAAPTFKACRILGSRSSGVRVCDHAVASISRCELLGNRLAGICLTASARPTLQDNRFEANGINHVLYEEVCSAESDEESAVLGVQQEATWGNAIGGRK